MKKKQIDELENLRSMQVADGDFQSATDPGNTLNEAKIRRNKIPDMGNSKTQTAKSVPGIFPKKDK